MVHVPGAAVLMDFYTITEALFFVFWGLFCCFRQRCQFDRKPRTVYRTIYVIKSIIKTVPHLLLCRHQVQKRTTLLMFPALGGCFD